MRKRILVAPLNWGLGHAARCIPIIKELQQAGFIPILGSDGDSLLLLQKEFPNLESIELPSYQISYPKKGNHFRFKMLWDTPKLVNAIKNEKKAIKRIVDTQQVDGIISDNRLGVHHKKIPSVFVTHQLNVLSGNTTWLSSKIHRSFIKKYNECWVPDVARKPNLSGRLGHLKNSKLPVKYIGPLSRLEKKMLPEAYELMVILSGPEPQRTLLEVKLLEELQKFHGKVLFVKGKLEQQQQIEERRNLRIYNFMDSKDLEKALNESKIVLARSGYTTIMDLTKLEKKAFFIPTPGQYEQEYLARRLKIKGIVPSCPQHKFKLSKLEIVKLYKGLSSIPTKNNLKDLFGLFEGK
ncbi:glycosyltransferase [Flavobacteriaceae bacterium M23B6Z8]